MNTISTRLSFVALGLAAVLPAMAQLGISRTVPFTPAADAMLDVSVATLAANGKLGILVPRMTDAQRIGIAPNAAAVGLIVYQTNAAMGYWYWDGAVWVPVSTGDGWSLFGNAGTAAATDYVGTADNQNFRMRTNSSAGVPPIGVTITAGATPGRVAINTATTAEALEVAGGMLINGGAPTNLAGNIIGVPGIFPGTTVHQGYLGAPASAWYQLENVFGERINQIYQTVSGTCNYPVPAAPNPDFSTGATGDFVTIGTGPITDGSSINTPYCTLWEDHRVQYLYLATELQAVLPNGGGPVTAICGAPYTIEGLAFRQVGGLSAEPMQQTEIKMVNTTTTALNTFNVGAMQLVYTSPSYVAVAGWNVHAFSTPFAWNGSGNVIVDYCFNNNNWINSGSSSIAFDNTTYSALFGSFCDACGSIGAPGTCNFTACPPGTAVAAGGTPCAGWSHFPGCQHYAGMSHQTCDGTFQWQGQEGNATRHPQIRFYCNVGAGSIVQNLGDYIYTPHGVIIADAAWATGGSFNFKGPGTISAKGQVWGGAFLLGDHVFDNYYTGEVKQEDAQAAKGYRHRSIDEIAAFIADNRHLPTIQGRDAWNTAGGFSVDKLNTDLWVTVEEQALHIKELNERMELLQKYLIEKRLAELNR